MMRIYGFTARNLKKKITFMPNEDSFRFDSEYGLSAVADGVTRDAMLYLPDLKTLKGKIKFALKYQKPSPAEIAANVFCNTFIDCMKCSINKDEKAIRESFEAANDFILGENERLGIIDKIDYCMNDYAGCVAAGTSVHDGVVNWGYICDCGIAIFDEKGNLRFRTENDGPDKYDPYIWKDKRLRNTNWRNPEARKIVRGEYRNNPEKEHSFGVLTGEKEAMYYVRTGTEEIKNGEHLIVYSYGLEKIIFSYEFADGLKQENLKKLKKLCQRKVRTEGTLVHYK